MNTRLLRQRCPSVIIIVFCTCLLAGCQHDHWADQFLTRQPQETDLVGSYGIDSQTLARNISVPHTTVSINPNSEIVLSADHHAQFSHMPEIRPIPPQSCLVDGSGSWTLGKNDAYFVVDVQIHPSDVRGTAGCGGPIYHEQLMIYGKNPPYKLHFTIGDPDAGDALQFEKAKQSAAGENSVQESSPAIHSEAAKAAPCLFDFELGEVPNCILQGPTGKLSVAPQYLTQLSFDSYGLAAVLSPIEGWMYVDRVGKVVVSGVPVMDNGADVFHDGLVRVVKNGKYGFANRRGQAVIPLLYDGALNFDKGRATVCQGCKTVCSDSGCEYHAFAGGKWLQIDTKGTILRRLAPNG